jgi:hypothetical protein
MIEYFYIQAQINIVVYDKQKNSPVASFFVSNTRYVAVNRNRLTRPYGRESRPT